VLSVDSSPTACSLTTGAIVWRNIVSDGVDKMRADMRERVWTNSAMVLRVDGDRPFEAGIVTFVMAAGRYCMLTAAHVWQDVARRDCFALSLESERRVVTVDRQVVVVHGVERGGDDATGPDLALIELAAPEVTRIKESKAFYDLDRADRRARLTELGPDALESGGWGIMGSPSEQTTEDDREMVARVTLFMSNVNPPVERDGFDYIDLRLGSRDRNVVPRSFGGLSGAGLWYFSRRPAVRPADEVWEANLCGVAFYQGPGPDSAYIRCHGPKSVYTRIRTAAAPSGRA
jgi:hypothetical protein